jgi:hypothetical protein
MSFTNRAAILAEAHDPRASLLSSRAGNAPGGHSPAAGRPIFGSALR